MLFEFIIVKDGCKLLLLEQNLIPNKTQMNSCTRLTTNYNSWKGVFCLTTHYQFNEIILYHAKLYVTCRSAESIKALLLNLLFNRYYYTDNYLMCVSKFIIHFSDTLYFCIFMHACIMHISVHGSNATRLQQIHTYYQLRKAIAENIFLTPLLI